MIKTKENNVRFMLLDLGVPPYLVDMAIPYSWFLPGTSDPDSPAVIELIRGLQRGLRGIGYKHVLVSGVLDRSTAKALDEISPPKGSWMEKTWVQLYGDVIDAAKNPEQKAFDIVNGKKGALGAYFEYKGPPVGPLPGAIVGTPPGPLGLGATATDAGVELNFGQGVKNKNIIVPIPKSSGPTYTAFKNLQRQINRLLSKRGTRIGEDGLIGINTYKGLQTAQDVIGMSVPGDENTGSMASNAVTIAGILSREADGMGIPKNANQGATTSPAALVESAKAPMTSMQAASFMGGGVGEAVKKYLPFLAIAGGVAWYAASQRKGGKKKKS